MVKMKRPLFLSLSLSLTLFLPSCNVIAHAYRVYRTTKNKCIGHFCRIKLKPRMGFLFWSQFWITYHRSGYFNKNHFRKKKLMKTIEMNFNRMKSDWSLMILSIYTLLVRTIFINDNSFAIIIIIIIPIWNDNIECFKIFFPKRNVKQNDFIDHKTSALFWNLSSLKCCVVVVHSGSKHHITLPF